MKRLTLSSLAVLLALQIAVRAQAPPAPPPPPCTPSPQLVCGQNGPEDLVVVPGSQWVVASVFGGSGGINLIRTSDRTTVLGYPGGTSKDQFDAKSYSNCPGPPDAAEKAKFATHGLSLQPGKNSIHRLLAVHHGGRESIEVFELDTRQATPSLTWVGCAVAPDPVGLNSVRWLADGGLIGTDFLARNITPERRAKTLEGEKNGQLWEWHNATGWKPVPGTDASAANGLEISEDGKWFYVAAWGSQSFFRVSRGQTPPKRDDIPLGFRVDNIRWAKDGSLLATGQSGATPATQEWVVVKIDPKTLKVTELMRRPNTDAFGGGTVAIEVGKDLWIGSFRGNRIGIFPVAK
jgi:sugar lactone lactonase YvrE